VPLVPLRDCVLVTLVDSQARKELDVFNSLELMASQVVPALEVEPLSEEFVGRLDVVLILHGHHKVVDEEEIPVAELRPPDAPLPPVKPRVKEVLCLLGGGVVGEDEIGHFELLRGLLFQEAERQKPSQPRLSSTSWTQYHHIALRNDLSFYEVAHSNCFQR